MATWQSSAHITGTTSGTATIRIESQLASSDSGGWNINWQLYYDQANGYNEGLNASLGGNASGSWGGPWYTTGYPHTFGIASGSFRVNCDANGNGSYGLSAGIQLYANSPGSVSTSGSTGLPRIAAPPTPSSLIADSFTPTSARLGLEISGYGHGTSANFNMYIRVQGTSSWTDLGNQGDVAGYNFWYPSGLTPGVTYEYIANLWNNNGDFSQTGVQSFETLPVSGMIAVMAGLL